MEPDSLGVPVPTDDSLGTPPVAPEPTPTPSGEGEPLPADAQPASAEPTPTVDAQPETFELPDGRKVDAATLSKEWKENFYPDYTRKSQALAAQQQTQPTASPLPTQTPTDPFADPNYVPQTFAEIAEYAKNAALNELKSEQQKEIEHRQQIETAVATQINEIRAEDPTLNENALFLHATKYGFRDLKLAHQNMKDMGMIVKTVQQQTAHNIQKRNQDPVSTTPGSSSPSLPDPSAFKSSRDYLRSLNL